jgi:hypothetical protein
VNPRLDVRADAALDCFLDFISESLDFKQYKLETSYLCLRKSSTMRLYSFGFSITR